MTSVSTRRAALGVILTLLLVGMACGDSSHDARDSVPRAIHIDSGTIDVPRSHLFYESAGSGPAVVLLHAGFLDRRMWDAQFWEFAASHSVVRYDVRGIGRSGPADSPYVAVEDLRILLDGLQIQRATLVGVSLGGRIAIDFAIQYPERVEGLVLAGPGLSGYAWTIDPNEPWRVAARAAAARGDTLAMALTWMESDYMVPATEQPQIAAKVRILLAENVRFWKSLLANGDQEIQPPSALGQLQEIEAPVLIVVGTREVEAILAIADSLGSKLPHARTVVLEGVGHFANLEQPETFNREVLTFLSAGRLPR